MAVHGRWVSKGLNPSALFYFGETKVGGFPLIISQTFVGGNIGYRKTGELQRLAYVSDLRIIHDLVQCLGKSDSIGFARIHRGNKRQRRAGYGFVEYSVSFGGTGPEFPEKPPGHVVDRANIDVLSIKPIETCDMRARHHDGGKEGHAAGDPRQ